VRAETARGEVEGGEDFADRAAKLLREGVQHVLRANLLAARALGLALRAFEQIEHRAGQVRGVSPAPDRRERALGGAGEIHRVDAGTPENLGAPGRAREHRHEQMERQDLRMLALVRERLGADDDRTRLGSEAVEGE
jgi:hypothetical protein